MIDPSRHPRFRTLAASAILGVTLLSPSAAHGSCSELRTFAQATAYSSDPVIVATVVSFTTGRGPRAVDVHVSRVLRGRVKKGRLRIWGGLTSAMPGLEPERLPIGSGAAFLLSREEGDLVPEGAYHLPACSEAFVRIRTTDSDRGLEESAVDEWVRDSRRKIR